MIRFAAAVFTVLSAGLVSAHDVKHYPHMTQADRDWFNGLTNKKGGNCCSMTDGVTVNDPDWEIGAIGYRVRVEGEWFDVPPDALVTGPNRAGTAVVWPYRQNGTLGIRCFMPGAGI